MECITKTSTVGIAVKGTGSCGPRYGQCKNRKFKATHKRRKQQIKGVCDINANNPEGKGPLNGKLLSISICEVGGALATTGADNSQTPTRADEGISYKTVYEECRHAGAIVVRQVHRRVDALICSQSAVLNCTQRVRKALKFGIAIVDVAWIRNCLKMKQLLEFAPFSLNDLAENAATLRICAANSREEKNHVPCVDTVTKFTNGTTDLGCCCVCHDFGKDDCEWCHTCHLSTGT